MPVPKSKMDEINELLSGGSEVQLQRALRLLDVELRSQPAEAYLVELKSRVLSLLNRHSEAIEMGKKATRMIPDQSLFWHNLGITYIRAGSPSDAFVCLEKAVELDKDDEGALYNFVQMLVSYPIRNTARRVREVLEVLRSHATSSLGFKALAYCALYFQDYDLMLDAVAKSWARFKEQPPLPWDVMLRDVSDDIVDEIQSGVVARIRGEALGVHHFAALRELTQLAQRLLRDGKSREEVLEAVRDDHEDMLETLHGVSARVVPSQAAAERVLRLLEERPGPTPGMRSLLADD